MIILLYIVYISLFLCKTLEVHASYPLKNETNTRYSEDKQYLILEKSAAMSTYHRYIVCLISQGKLYLQINFRTENITQTFYFSYHIFL